MQLIGPDTHLTLYEGRGDNSVEAGRHIDWQTEFSEAWGNAMKTNLFGAMGTLVLGGLLLCSSSIATASEVPEPFQGFDENSKYAMSYENLNAMLDVVVVDIGRSDRTRAPREKETTGTRLKAKVNRWTVNEGNRFFYETFVDNETAKLQLDEVKKGIENATAQVGLNRFTRDEQLAYWLNLYNVTLMNEIVKVYPQRDLKKFLYGRDSILARKLLVVEGVSLSLNDIQYTILQQNYDRNPLVIYGLYQGIIGGPNVRRTAYTGKTVYDALTENAVVFINSNRGTATKSAKKFLVSSFYERNKEYFPNFQSDLTAHLLQYLEGNELAALKTATALDADISDWTVTDLGGTRREVGGSLANNSAAMMGAVQGASSSNYGASASSGAGAGGINSAIARQAQEKNEDDEEASEDSDSGEDQKNPTGGP